MTQIVQANGYARLFLALLAAAFILVCLACGGGGSGSRGSSTPQQRAVEEQRRAALTPEQRVAEDNAKAAAETQKTQDLEGADHILNANVFAKDNVRRFLRRPDDAGFGRWDEPEVKFNPEQDTFWLSSAVTAKNDLGKELTYRWEAIVVRNGKAWELAFCAIDGETVYTSSALLENIIAKEQQKTVTKHSADSGGITTVSTKADPKGPSDSHTLATMQSSVHADWNDEQDGHGKIIVIDPGNATEEQLKVLGNQIHREMEGDTAQKFGFMTTPRQYGYK